MIVPGNYCYEFDNSISQIDSVLNYQHSKKGVLILYAHTRMYVLLIGFRRLQKRCGYDHIIGGSGLGPMGLANRLHVQKGWSEKNLNTSQRPLFGLVLAYKTTCCN